MSNININLPVFYENPFDIDQTQVNGVSHEFNSCRGCNQNLASDNPASQYQRQKLIQKTVRVQSSLYTMNLAGLAGYQKPLSTYQSVEQAGTPYLAPPRVYWNQMSDRARPAVQQVKTGSGSGYHVSSTRHTIVRNRPGAMSPGGVGVDIKHNSYDRYLNKLKGKAPLRRGVIPSGYGGYIPFVRSNPIYGGKIVKTSIINGCDCPDITDNLEADKRIYGSEVNAIQDKILATGYTFNIGDFVWAKKQYTTQLYKGKIINIVDGLYTVQFVDDNSIITTTFYGLFIYFDCNCISTPSITEDIMASEFNLINLVTKTAELQCNELSLLSQSGIL